MSEDKTSGIVIVDDPDQDDEPFTAEQRAATVAWWEQARPELLTWQGAFGYKVQHLPPPEGFELVSRDQFGEPLEAGDLQAAFRPVRWRGLPESLIGAPWAGHEPIARRIENITINGAMDHDPDDILESEQHPSWKAWRLICREATDARAASATWRESLGAGRAPTTEEKAVFSDAWWIERGRNE